MRTAEHSNSQAVCAKALTAGRFSGRPRHRRISAGGVLRRRPVTSEGPIVRRPWRERPRRAPVKTSRLRPRGRSRHGCPCPCPPRPHCRSGGRIAVLERRGSACGSVAGSARDCAADCRLWTGRTASASRRRLSDVSGGHHAVDHRAVLRVVKALRRSPYLAPPARGARGLRALTTRARSSSVGSCVMAGALADGDCATRT